MRKRKTIMDYSLRMPRGLKIRFLKNVVKQHGVDALFAEYKDLYDAVNQSMCWSETKEGCEFWNEIACRGIKPVYMDNRYKQYFKK